MAEHDKPLSEHEQRVLEEIEERLSRDDPRLAATVASTSLYTHIARRIRWETLAFVGGFIMLLLFPLSEWIAVAGFGVMLGSSLLVYQQLKRLGRDQLREWSRGGRFTLAGMLARMSERFRGPGGGSGPGRPDARG